MSKANETVTETIIKLIQDKQTLPWHKPWSACGGTRPQNLVSGNAYSGINSFLLGFGETPYWLTYKQAVAKGGNVRKGERGSKCIFLGSGKSKTKTDKKGNPESFTFLKTYSVFNASQCEGIEVPPTILDTRNDHERIAAASAIVDGYIAKPRIIETASTSAFYTPQRDQVTVPLLEQFEKAEEYYSTLFHELTHSTGHENRLKREGITNFDRFGSHQYTKEELIAEFGAAFLCNQAGIINETIDNSAAYLNSWVSKLRANPNWLVSAASQAQKAVDHISPVVTEELAQAA